MIDSWDQTTQRAGELVNPTVSGWGCAWLCGTSPDAMLCHTLPCLLSKTAQTARSKAIKAPRLPASILQQEAQSLVNLVTFIMSCSIFFSPSPTSFTSDCHTCDRHYRQGLPLCYHLCFGSGSTEQVALAAKLEACCTTSCVTSVVHWIIAMQTISPVNHTASPLLMLMRRILVAERRPRHARPVGSLGLGRALSLTSGGTRTPCSALPDPPRRSAISRCQTRTLVY